MKFGKYFAAVCAAVVLSSGVGMAQEGGESKNSRYDRFLELLSDLPIDTVSIGNLIDVWDREDPEYYVAAHNYWFLISRETGIEMVAGAPTGGEDDVMVLYPEGQNDGEPVGYLRSGEYFKEKEMNKAEVVLKEGIAKFPDRLDMRFGLVRFYIEKAQFGDAVAAMQNVIDRNKENGGSWLWSLNEDLPGEESAKEFLDEVFQHYFSDFVNDGSEEDSMNLVETLLRYDPENAIFISDKASLMFMQWRFDEAMALYEKALALQPDDMLITGNLAYGYYQTNQFDKAQKYAEILQQKGDAGEKKWGAALIEAIQEEQAKQYMKVDIQDLKKYAKKNATEYDKLLSRFIAADETLTDDEVFHIYYAAPFLGHETSMVKTKEFDDAYNSGQFEEAFEIGEKLLQDECPVSLQLLSKMYVLARHFDKPTDSYAIRYFRLTDAIFSTGNGRSKESAVAVIAVSDEYSLLNDFFGMKMFGGQVLLEDDGHHIDEMKFTDDNGTKIRYFNVDIQFYLYDQMIY